MDKIIITGAAGFVGFHLATELVRRGKYELTLVDNLQRGRRDQAFENLLSNKNITFINADLTDSESFLKLPKDVTYIYHLAAVIGVQNVLENPDRVLYVNALTTLNLFEWVKQCTQLKKLLFSSTSEIYAGTLKHFGVEIPTPESIPLALADIKDERTTYALSKMYGESICHNYGKKYGIRTTIVRYHNVYGPRMGFKHVIPEMIVKISKQDEIDIASPRHTRAFCYIDDAVNMTIALCEHEAATGETFHVGNQENEVEIRELVQHVASAMDRSVVLQDSEDTPGSPVRRCPDTSKTRVITGFDPKIPLSEGIRRTYSWYKDKLQDLYE